MRYKQLTETSPGTNISMVVQTILVAMTANGIDEIEPEELSKVISQKYHLELNPNILVDIVNDLPIVQSADEQLIVLGNEQEMSVDDSAEESSKDKVAQMAADTPTEKPGIDTWTTT